MDHVIDAMRPHYEALLDCFIEEQRKEKYRRLSANPYWPELKALNDSMNILRKYLGWDNISLASEIRLILSR